MKSNKVLIVLYVFLLGVVCFMFYKMEQNNDKTDLLELKARVSEIVTNDSLNTIKLQAKILASDSIISVLKERNKKNESEITRLKKAITDYSYTSDMLPEL